MKPFNSLTKDQVRHNIVVLTSGLSGSSVITALIARAGYSTGESTYHKPDYDTCENERLVSLNERLLEFADYGNKYSERVLGEKLELIKSLASNTSCELDLAPYRGFVDSLRNQQPWLWKDPRLWATFPFWLHLLENQPIKLVFVDRSMPQRWISEILRRNIQSYAYLKDYNKQIKSIILDIAEKNHLPLFEMEFDELILKPAHSIEKLNQFLGSSLEVSDLHQIYHLPLNTRPRGWRDFALALLIYIKNYSNRLR